MTTTTTSCAGVAPYLDDPVAFARFLFSALAAAGEPRILDAAGVEDLEGGDASEAAILAHEAGIRFGIAAETLRRSLIAGAEAA